MTPLLVCLNILKQDNKQHFIYTKKLKKTCQIKLTNKQQILTNHKSPLVTKMDILRNTLCQTIGIKNDGPNTTHNRPIIFISHSPISLTRKINNNIYNVSYHDHPVKAYSII